MSDYTLSYTGEEVNGLLNTVNSNHAAWDSISQTQDRIISQGVSGDWSYRKWESGIAECWTKKVVNTDITNAWGQFNLGTNALNSSSYPVEFVDYPIVTAGAQGVNHNYAVISVIESTTNSLTNSPLVYVGRPNNSGVTAFKDYLISIYVVGRWK